MNTTRHLGNDVLVFATGVYMYSYMTSREKFDETKLPPIEAFYDKLNDKPLENADYERAQKTWTHFGMRTTQKDYHNHYLLSDVLLLADVFENFRNTITEYNVDCHFVTLPPLAWTLALKFTGVELDLVTDPDAYLTIENNMRGGIATTSHRYVAANNPLVDGYDSTEPTSYIIYLDANNLYGKAIRSPLPVGKFQFLSQSKIGQCDLMSV